MQQRWLDNIQSGQFGVSPWTAKLDVDDCDSSVPRLVHALGAQIWSPYWGNVTQTGIDEAHALGLNVAVWPVNGPRDVAAMIGLGVDSINSDDPYRLHAVMAAQGLSLPNQYFLLD